MYQPSSHGHGPSGASQISTMKVDAGGRGKRASRGDRMIDAANNETISSEVQYITYLVSQNSFSTSPTLSAFGGSLIAYEI